MQFIGDYHMHTTYSDGRGTVGDMVLAGQSCGLKEVGLADHGPNNIGTGVKNSQSFLAIKAELTQLQVDNPELQLFSGAEADVISLAGDLDVEVKVIKELDYLIVGLHPLAWPADLGGMAWLLENQLVKLVPALRTRVKNNNTKALIEAIYKHDVWAISHPGLKMPLEIAEVARACAARNTAWEINTGHKHPTYHEVIEADHFGVDFVVNSDAHYPETVGSLEYGSWVLEKVGVGTERVRNAVRDG